MMRRERLMATLQGKPVDRPAVSFYEIDGSQDVNNPDPFNIFSHPSWKPLIELAREKTDRIVRRGASFKNMPPDPLQPLRKTETQLDDNGSYWATSTIRGKSRVLTARTRRDRDLDTTWTLEHLLKDVDDLKTFLDLPEPELGGEPDISGILDLEKQIGDAGIVMIDAGDPLCEAAALFDMATYTIIAMTEPELFHQLLDRIARVCYWRTEAFAKALPGRLWRICGPEYASPPYLPPTLFHEYVTEYDKPLVASIQRYGGYARIHSHGRLKAILDEIISTGGVGLDPIEPPPQGDVELSYVREKYGQQLVLFGNLEISDIETLDAAAFEQKVQQAIREGTAGQGRGFVLMPSACPIGRVLSSKTLRNYEIMIAGLDQG